MPQPHARRVFVLAATTASAVLVGAACSVSSSALSVECAALEACCTTLPASEQNACSAVANGTDATACASTYSSFMCGAVTAVSSCQQLQTCCLRLPATESPTCNDTVAAGNATSCSTSLQTFSCSTTGTGDAGGSCAALSTCCQGMTGAAQAACQAIANTGAADACASEPTVYESEDACSSTPQPEAGPHPEAGHDAGLVDAPSNDAIDFGDSETTPDSGGPVDSGAVDAPPDGPTPVGTTLYAGSAGVFGITDDGYVVYEPITSETTGELYAVSATGTGTPTPVEITSGTFDVGVVHDVVEVIENPASSTGIGTLAVWTNASGTLSTLASNSVGLLQVSADSSFILYTANMNAAGTVGDLVVASSNGTGAKTLESQVNLDFSATTSPCVPGALFDEAFLVVSTCTTTGTTPTITVYDGAGGAWTTTVAQSSGVGPYFATDAVGGALLTVSSTAPNALSLSALDAPATLKPVFGHVGSTPFLYLAKNAGFALYTDYDGGLGISFLGAGPSVTASTVIAGPTDAGTGLGGVAAVSPDEHYAVTYGEALDSTLEVPTSLYLQTLPSQGASVAAPHTLGTNGPLYTFASTDTFTGDSQYLFYTTNLVANGQPAGSVNLGSTGTLFTASTSTGTIDELVTNTTVWNANSLGANSNVIYNQNYVLNGASVNGSATADLYVTAANGAGAGQLIVAGADANYYVVAAAPVNKTKVVYSFTSGDSTDGIYLAAIPAP